jgi:hypothetical protein
MSKMTIFSNPTAVARRTDRELSPLAQALATNNFNTRRIQTGTNGTFKRLVNGEKIGKALKGEINVIIVNAQPKVSRVYYEAAYDPDSEPTLPNCWSNQGDAPEPNAPDKQHSNCADCPMNIKGSGGGEKRACRFQRRVAVLVEGDESGELYQFNIPSKSLFGKGSGNVHPFESYIKFLLANGVSPDDVITNVSYDEEAESMTLLFQPVRHITDEEYELVQEAQKTPEAKLYTQITVAQNDKVTKTPEKSKPKVKSSDEPDDEDEDEPVKAPIAKKKKPVVVEDEDEDEDDEPVKTPVTKKKKPVVEDDDEDEEEPPTRKRSGKTRRPITEKAEDDSDEDSPVKDKLASILSEWSEDD